MTLLKSQQLRLATVVALFICYGGILNAKSFTITGKIVDDNDDPVGKANVDVLLDGESQLKKPTQTHKKKGTFSVKIKDFEPGDYTVSVEHSDKGTGSLMISLDEGKKKDLGEIPISNAPKEVVAEGNPGESTQQSKAPKSMPTSIPSLEPSLPRAPEATGVPSKHFIVNELITTNISLGFSDTDAKIDAGNDYETYDASFGINFAFPWAYIAVTNGYSFNDYKKADSSVSTGRLRSDVANTFDIMVTKAIGDIFPAIDPNRSFFINLSYEKIQSEGNILNYDYITDSFSLSFSRSFNLN